jgi:hypothetical protein
MSCTVSRIAADTHKILVKFNNSTCEVDVTIYFRSDICRDSLENVMERTEKLLPFCQNVRKIDLSIKSSGPEFFIVMRHGGLNCKISVSQSLISARIPVDCPNIMFNCIYAKDCEKFLERLSTTPLYKRPEFIKVAAKNNID